jgi:long-chain acyl-CoA synthetase
MSTSIRTPQLRGFEYVKIIHLESELFSLENGMLTPTMKLKRNEGKIKYEKEIAGMYAQLNAKAAQQKSKL